MNLAVLVEPLDPRVPAVGDVDAAAMLVDRHADRDLELAGAGPVLPNESSRSRNDTSV